MIAHVRSYAYFMETKPHCVLLKMTNHFLDLLASLQQIVEMGNNATSPLPLSPSFASLSPLLALSQLTSAGSLPMSLPTLTPTISPIKQESFLL